MTAETETETRVFYDAIAEDYAEHFRDAMARRPLERALLSAFAELVQPDGEVADLGCGPGEVTGYLAARGLRVFGLDLSKGMLAVARREHPGLRFVQGTMRELDLPDGGLAGAVSWYSSIHTPVDELPALFAELYRVLAPGAPLLVAFQAGDEPRRLVEPFGHPVTLDFLRRRPGDVAAVLAGVGFDVFSRTEKSADASLGETAAQAFLLARR
ncbi:methyltransferase domain-containing protein [Streptomyces sp. NPDC014776]|uniref:class I SAM-dependent methyltransferase n=1 Tax=Streptomyces sp. NPDC014776 TaxID=3364909 RepID=UPI003701D3A0